MNGEERGYNVYDAEEIICDEILLHSLHTIPYVEGIHCNHTETHLAKAYTSFSIYFCLICIDAAV